MSSTRSGMVVTWNLLSSAVLSGMDEVNVRTMRRSMSMEISEGGVRGRGGGRGVCVGREGGVLKGSERGVGRGRGERGGMRGWERRG